MKNTVSSVPGELMRLKIKRIWYYYLRGETAGKQPWGKMPGGNDMKDYKIRKYIAVPVIAALLFATAFTACSSKDEEEGKEAPVVLSGGENGTPGGQKSAEDAESMASEGKVYYWEYGGMKLIMNMEVSEDAIMGLSDGVSKFESDSCAYQGKDKVFTFPSFIIRTYPTDGKDYISSVEFRDDTVTTLEGLYIGCTRDEVIAKYGDPSSEGTGGLDYIKGDSMLSFIISGDKVDAIMYSAITE